MKTDLFQCCGYCWVFQICWHIECGTFTALSFRIWNSSTGIPFPPLALFIVMLSKAHLTLHSRMSGSRSVITPSWSSVLWRSFLYSSFVYSHHLFLISGEGNGSSRKYSCLGKSHWWRNLAGYSQWSRKELNTTEWLHYLSFLISSASVRSIQFLSFILPNFAWNHPLVSLIFLKRSLVFPILLPSSISLHWSLRKTFLTPLALLWNSASRWVYLSFSPLLSTSLHFSGICKASTDSHFAFLHFFFLAMVLITASCTMPWTSGHSSSGTVCQT